LSANQKSAPSACPAEHFGWASFIAPLTQLQGIYWNVIPGTNGPQTCHPTRRLLLIGQIILKGLVAVLCLIFIATGNTRIEKTRRVYLFVYPNSHDAFPLNLKPID
jgi:hypothetical protein